MLMVILAGLLGLGTIALPDALLSPHGTLHTSNGCPIDRAWTDDVLAAALGVSEAKVEKLHDIRGLTGLEICTMERGKLDRALVKVEQQPRPDQPAEAEEFRRKQQAGDDGQVRLDGLANALAQRTTLVSPRGIKAAGIDHNAWTPIGPGNIGGRIRAIVTHPTDPNLLFVGSVTGGLWKSTNGGTSWAAINDFMPNVAISTLVRDPSNPLRMYAGTGESSTGNRGYGAFVSVDGGTTWAQLGGTVPDVTTPPATQQSDFLYVDRIAVHPTNPDIVLIGTSGYYCNWGGVYRTTNATAASPTWTRVYGRRSLDVRFDPNNGNSVVVGEGAHCAPVSPFPADGGAIAYSTTAGAAFTRVPLDTLTKGRVEVAWAPATSGLAVAVTEGNGGAGASGRLWRSLDSGATWSLNSHPGHLSNQGWYNNAVWVDPTDSTWIVVGGLDIYRGAGAASWWTTNTAVPWAKISRWDLWPSSVHADNHGIVNASNYNGSSNRVVYIGDDGGLWKSNDIASHNGVDFVTNWVNLNNGLPITQFYSGAATIAAGVERIVGGTQDNGSLKAPVATSGTTWSTFFGGDGGYSAVDPADPNYYYGEYVYASIHRATTGGNSAIICAGPNPITEGLTGTCGASSTSQANFISPFVLDPNNANTMLVGANSLWRSTDVKAATPHWFTMKAPDVSAGSNYISAITVVSGNPDLVWVGHNHGEVYCTVNGTAASPTWTKVTALTATRMVLRILVDKLAPANRVYVTYGGFNGGNVQELNDATQVCKAAPTVTNRHGNLPQAPVRSILRATNATSSLFVGTEVGIFGSTDGGVTWSASNDGPGTVTVDELFWVDQYRLFAATYGRGMFKTNLAPPTCTPLANPGTKSFLFGATNTQQCFSVSVPAGQSFFSVQTAGGIGNADLYVKRGAIPTTGVFDCSSSGGTTAELCNIASPVADTWYVMINSAAAFDGVTLTAQSSGAVGPPSLSNLMLSAGTLSPAFASATTSYTADVTSIGNTITVTPTVTSAGSTVKVNSVSVASGTPSGPITLSLGTNPISVVVTAADTVTTATYAVNVTYAQCTALSNNVPVPSLAGATGSQQCFYIDVPAGRTSLVVQTAGGSGDADLYVKQGAIPTQAVNDCASEGGTTTELCTFLSPATARWYAMLYGYASFSGTSLTAQYVPAVAGCTYSLSPLDLSSQPKTAGTVNITVTTAGGCPVTATSFQPWITFGTITSIGGTTTVPVNLLANPGAARATSIVVAGQLYLVTQLAGP